MLRIWIHNHPIKFWVIISFLLFIIPLGESHLFDWDEINFAENAREMIHSKNYLAVQLNFEPFFEKPPLFIWLQTLSFNLFQVYTSSPLVSMEFAARFPNSMIGVLTILSLFLIGRKTINANFGHWWSFSYLVALAPHIYASSGIIDPTFNLFIFLSLYFTWLSVHHKIWQNTLIAGFILGLAMLTKGPVALLIWALTSLFYAIFRFKSIPNLPRLAFQGFILVFLASTLFFSWYYALSIKYGWVIFEEFIQYQIRLLTTGDAGHGQPFYYHFFVLLFVVFPISGFAFPELFKFRKIKTLLNLPEQDFDALMRILFWTVLILFSLAKTKIIHYSSMCWIPMTFIGAKILYQYQNEGKRFSWPIKGLSLLIGLILSILFLALPYIGQHAGELLYLIQDLFVQGNLKAPVFWPNWIYGIGIIMLITHLSFGFIQLNKGVKWIVFWFMSFIGVSTLISTTLFSKIEAYTQGSLIDFCESKAFQKVYVETLGFKSYAPYLYFQKQEKGPSPQEILEAKSLDRPAYFIMKNNAPDSLKYHPNLRFIQEENGFLFYKKKLSEEEISF